MRKQLTFVTETLRAPLRLTLLNYSAIIKIEKERNMKQIVVGIIVVTFFASLALGVLNVVINFFMNNCEMTGEAAAELLAIFLLAIISPVLLDLLESFLK